MMSTSESEVEAWIATLNPHEFWSRFVQPRIAQIQKIIPLMSTDLIVDARRTLDNELDALHLAICYLRTGRNALSPISCLPDEALALIFKFIAATTPVELEFESFNPDFIIPPPMSPPFTFKFPTATTSLAGISEPPLGLIQATHVCRRWRDVALSQASLWGNITHELGPQWQELMLSRAQSTPVSICLPSCRPEQTALIARHISHTRDLCLAAHPDTLKTICHSLTTPAAMLTYLKIVNYEIQSIFLPKTVFAGHTPSLRHVILYGVVFPWSSPIFRNLTNLRMFSDRPVNPSYAPDTSALEPDFDSFLCALENMPALETLDLSFCLPSRRYSPTKHDTAALPCLKLLSLRGATTDCIDIVAHLKIPSSCRLALRCHEGAHWEIDYLLPFIKEHTHNSTEEPLRTLFISLPTDDYGDRFAVEIWRTYRSLDLELSGARPDGDPAITIWFPVAWNSVAALEALCAVLPLDNLRVLSVTYQHRAWGIRCWIRMFERCTSLERVHVAGRNAVYFRAALEPQVLEEPQDALTPERLFLRQLKSLQVTEVDFGVNEDDESFFDVLDHCLRLRLRIIKTAQLGKSDSDVYGKLESLVIARCKVPMKFMPAVRKIVQDLRSEGVQVVTWDGEIEEEDEDEEDEDED